MKQKIWVYDDVDDFSKIWVEKLRSIEEVDANYEPMLMDNTLFQKVVNELMSRQESFRKKKSYECNYIPIDDSSIFIIDYDLLNIEQKSFLTGEIVAYLARSFSKCKYIIGINQYGTNPFDMTLKGHPEAYCDLNLGSEQIDNPGLWSDKKTSFRPWSWPSIPSYIGQIDKKIEDVKSNLDNPIVDVLNIREISDTFSRTTIEYLGNEVEEVTFRSFLLDSVLGYKRKDIIEDEDLLSIMAASRLSKWLERLVLPGQDILVDAPHLVYRFPSLLLNDPSDIANWNLTTEFKKPEELGIDHSIISDCIFEKNYWLSRPTWFWSKISRNQTIKEITEPWERRTTESRFCEDSSAFHHKNNCLEFIIESESPYSRRFIYHKNLTSANYRPAARFV